MSAWAAVSSGSMSTAWSASNDFAADQYLVTLHHPLRADALETAEGRHHGQRSDLIRRAPGDRLRDRMLRGVFDGTGHPQHLGAIGADGRVDIEQRHPAGGHGAGLVQHDGVDRPGGLQYLRPPDQDPELRAASGADQQRGRRRESQGTRARDDQHGNRRGERCRDREAGPEPAGQGGHRDADHDRHEHPGDLVGQSLDISLAGLGIFDQSGHAGQLGVRTDPVGADQQSSTRVDGRADNRVAGADLDGHRFTGEHRRVHRGGAVDDHTVGGDLLTGADDEDITDHQFRHRNPGFDIITNHDDILRPEFEHRP